MKRETLEVVLKVSVGAGLSRDSQSSDRIIRRNRGINPLLQIGGIVVLTY